MRENVTLKTGMFHPGFGQLLVAAFKLRRLMESLASLMNVTRNGKKMDACSCD
jgi:hypothetical protein